MAEHQQQSQQPPSRQVAKAATCATAGCSLLLLSGVTLAATIVGLTVVTPLLVIFSPVLVPAAITVCLILAGFSASGGFGVAAVTVMSWIYRYVTGKRPLGVEQAKMKLTGKAREIRSS